MSAPPDRFANVLVEGVLYLLTLMRSMPGSALEADAQGMLMARNVHIATVWNRALSHEQRPDLSD